MTEKLIPVTVNMPSKVWYQLAGVAERQGVKIADVLLARASVEKVAPPPKPPAGSLPSVAYGADPIDIRIGALHSVGLTDGQIGEALSHSRSFVIKRRKNLGLPANSRGGGDMRSSKFKAARAAEESSK